MNNSLPFVSIVMPVYNSHVTLAASLETMLSQTYPCYEIVVIDSSPNNKCEEIVRARFPHITYHHSRRRLYPHAARNLGIDRARGELILSTDPDIYAPSDWLHTLVQAYRTTGCPIAGSYLNYGHNYFDNAIHLCKFDTWLPGGEMRPIDIGPTANILYPRPFLEAIDKFSDDSMLGDTIASWDLTRLGLPIYFAPHAVVGHHHTQTIFQFAAERYTRGQEFARLRMDYYDWTRATIALTVLITILQIRLCKLFYRTASHAWQAQLGLQLLISAPIILLGHGAWLTGEVAAYGHALRTAQK